MIKWSYNDYIYSWWIDLWFFDALNFVNQENFHQFVSSSECPQRQTATSSVQFLRRRGISGCLWTVGRQLRLMPAFLHRLPWEPQEKSSPNTWLQVAGLFRTTFRGPMPPTGTWQVSNFGWKHCQSRVGGAAERWKLSAWRPDLHFCHLSLGFHGLFNKNLESLVAVHNINQSGETRLCNWGRPSPTKSQSGASVLAPRTLDVQ